GYRTGINAACYRDAIRDSRIASFASRIRFASGISNSLKAAVVSAGWRSLDAGAIVRGASLNAISSLLGNEKWGRIKYLTLISLPRGKYTHVMDHFSRERFPPPV